MIKLTARIQLFGSGTNKYNYVSISNGKNNISSPIEKVLNTRIRSGNAFLFGSSKLGSGATFSNGVDYYIGNALSSKSEPYQFQSYYIIRFRPTYDNITIVFDDVGNGYPPTITTYPTATYTTDDAIVTISGLDTSRNDYQISIDYWNKPNAPLIIRGIYTDVSIDLDYNNLISMSGSIFERSDYKLPNFGIISNSGNIEFNDIDGEILDYAEEGWLTGGLETKLKLTNTLVKNAQTDVGTYYTAIWNYDTDNRTVSVSIKDDLEEWQDINVEGFNYDPRTPNKVLKNKTMANLYKWLWDRTPSKYKMQTLEELDEVTRTKLNSTYIEYPLLKSGNLWQQWSKFCEANQTHIYKNFDGITVCKYNGGN
jgi:hypothetical protein